MSARVPAGSPDGGQFAPQAHAESAVSLATQDTPETPVSAEVPKVNRERRAAALNMRWHRVATRPGEYDDLQRCAAARAAVRRALRDGEGLDGVDHTPDEATETVERALGRDRLLLTAVDEVGHLESGEVRGYGSRLGGVLYRLAGPEPDDEDTADPVLGRPAQTTRVLASDLVDALEPHDPERGYYEDQIARNGDHHV